MLRKRDTNHFLVKYQSRIRDIIKDHFFLSQQNEKNSKHPSTNFSLGELTDEITILQIKTQHLQDTALKHVITELNALECTLNNLNLSINPKLIEQLKEVNQILWNIEDDIREQERAL